MPFPMPSAEWVLSSDPITWERHARAAFEANVDGESPLDVTKKNILNYAQGSFSMVVDDLVATMPTELAEICINALINEGLEAAFSLRRNLVSLKKILLHCWHASSPLEHELHRFATFWRDDMNFDNGFVNSVRYREICITHMRCKGATHAAYDGRVLTKQICCVPRHPDSSRPARLRELPHSLTTMSWLKQARKELRGIGEGTDFGEGDASKWHGDTSRDTTDTSGNGTPSTSGNDCDEVETLTETPARVALDAFLENVSARINTYMTTLKTHTGEECTRWPPHLTHHVEQILIARGASKAIAIRYETVLYGKVLTDLANQFDQVLKVIEAKTLSVERVLRDDFGVDGIGVFRKRNVDFGEEAILKLKEGTVFDRLTGLLQGCAPATRDIAVQINNIVKNPSKRIFTSGDDGGADFFPSDFKLGEYISMHRKVVERWRPVMYRELEILVPGAAVGLNDEDGQPTVSNEAWPPDTGTTPLLAYLRGKQKCTSCSGNFGGLWITYGTCFRCDLIGRWRGRCPRSAVSVNSDDANNTSSPKVVGPRLSKKSCPQSAWCPHHKRCLSCEVLTFQGCSVCGIIRGDGEDVVSMVETKDLTGNYVVFLDFDRTLCATKVGSSPIVKSKSETDDQTEKTFAEHDTHLLSIILSHSQTHVVTRNRHVDDIISFLAHHGVRDADRKVHHVGKGESKARVMVDVLGKNTGKNKSAYHTSSGVQTISHTNPSAVFVDDSIAELLDEEVAAIPGLQRVLFSRVVA